MLKHRYTFYFAFFAIALLSFINRDLTPVNELKYISIALEALQSNHWFAFYNHGQIYADKPPVYFWIIMVGIKLFGTNGAALFTCLFSILPAIGIAEVMHRWTKHELKPAMGNIAVVMLISSGLFLACAIILRMDMLMALFITLALYQFHLAFIRQQQYLAPSAQRYFILLFILLALLIKGPVGLLLPVLSIFAFLWQKKSLKQWSLYFPLKGVLLFLLIIGLWGLGIDYDGGHQYLYQLTIGQALKRGIHASVHPEPIYYYLQSAFSTLQPWSLLLVVSGLGFILQFFKSKSQLETQSKLSDTACLFLTVTITGVVMLSAVSSKLEIYFLPLMPFVIFASVMILQQLNERKWWLWGLYPIAVLTMIAPIVALFFTSALDKLPVSLSDAYLLLASLFIFGVITMGLLLKQKYQHAVVSLGCTMLAIILVAALVVPKYNNLLGVEQVANLAQQQSPKYGNQGYYAYKKESLQNMDVYFNQPVRLINTVQQAVNLKVGSVIITKNKQAEIIKALAAKGQKPSYINTEGKYTLLVR
ncbi:ArnT family glycosyltransferase [Vibrio algicola]|uniref:Glycosyltransferase RgtA/B/C/D-like domain-containing protein n=1 Tax=Vibrio algicola TaxID=2662262 RepID=A0A5Q0TDM8_9VIBR|nr:glycosyltransferase family 39 protein [Vibrio algicola]